MTNVFALPDLTAVAKTLAAANTERANWDWEDEPRWRKLSRQDFYAAWYDADATQHEYLANYPPFLDLTPLDPVCVLRESSILVRNSYVDTFKLVFGRGLERPDSGVVITGQPGTGKTSFQYYLLARLLQQKQVVLFSPTGEQLWLFFHGDLYKAPVDTLNELPRPSPNSSHKVFIWSLFDITKPEGPNTVLHRPGCFPVQTASPNDVRFQWIKTRSGLLVYFPLWTDEELCVGLQLHPSFPKLLQELGQLYPQEAADGQVVLQSYKGLWKVLQNYQTEHQDGTLSVDGAVQYALDAAIARFGHAARDVFDAIFDFDVMTHHHHAAIPSSYDELVKVALTAKALGIDAGATIHRIIAISPTADGMAFDMDFKSPWIGGELFRHLAAAEIDGLRRQILRLRLSSNTSTLAGHMFEHYVHRTLCRPAQPVTPALLTLLKQNSTASSTTFSTTFSTKFSFAPSSSSSSSPSRVTFSAAQRPIIYLEDTLPERFTPETYYVPMASNYPLIDAYVVDIGANGPAILWLIQITISSRAHAGSAKGYIKARKIVGELKKHMQQVRKQKEPPKKRQKTRKDDGPRPPDVVVRWLLVVPEEAGIAKEVDEYSWNLPKGWDDNVAQHDHRGDVYCLRLPLSLTQ